VCVCVRSRASVRGYVHEDFACKHTCTCICVHVHTSYANTQYAYCRALAALMACVLLSLFVAGQQTGSTVLYSLGGRGAPYYPESFGGLPRPYSEHSRLGMVEYMPQNETSWWDFSE
jgi:hypothetical protein